MGYNYRSANHNISIPVAAEKDIVKAAHELARTQELPKTGFISEFDGLDKIESLHDLTSWAGFETYDEEDGEINMSYYEGRFFEVIPFLTIIGPYISADSYIEWFGEDHERFTHIFVDGKPYERAAVDLFSSARESQSVFIEGLISELPATTEGVAELQALSVKEREDFLDAHVDEIAVMVAELATKINALITTN